MDQFLSNPSSLDGLPLFSHQEGSELVNSSNGNVDLFTLIFNEGGESQPPSLSVSTDAAVIELESPYSFDTLLPEQSTISTSSETGSSPISSPFETPSPPAYYYDNMNSINFSPDSSLTIEFNAIATIPEEDQKGNGKKKNQKKRRRYELKGNTPVSLSRDQLLSLSSTDLEEYIQALSKQRRLSQEELRELRHQRRIIKNREYAQQSRKKKKSHYEVLEGTIDQLTQENEELKKENQELRSQIAHLRSFYKTESPTITALGSNNFVKDPKHPIGVKGIGACLLIMIFSFALVFNPNVGGRSFGGHGGGGDGYQRSPYNRVLLNIEEETWWRAILNRLFEGPSSVTITTTTITGIFDTTEASSKGAPPSNSQKEKEKEALGLDPTLVETRCGGSDLTEEERIRCMTELRNDFLRTVPESASTIQAA
jgi:cell division protein FtsB